MGRVLIDIDARTEELQRQIDKVTQKLEKMAEKPAKAAAASGGFGQMVSKLAAAAALVQTVSSGLDTWNRRLEEGVAKTKSFADAMKKVMGGAGDLSNLGAMQAHVLQRRSAMPLQADAEFLGSYTGAFPDSKISHKTGALQSAEYASMAGLPLQEFGKTMGSLQRSGLAAGPAEDVAAFMSQGLGDAASSAVGPVAQLIQNGVPPEDAARAAMLAQRGGMGGEVLIKLLALWKRGGSKGSFVDFIATVRPQRLGEQSPRVAAAQDWMSKNELPTMGGPNFLQRQAAIAMQTPGQDEIYHADRIRRQTEVAVARRGMSSDAALSADYELNKARSPFFELMSSLTGPVHKAAFMGLESTRRVKQYEMGKDREKTTREIEAINANTEAIRAQQIRPMIPQENATGSR